MYSFICYGIWVPPSAVDRRITIIVFFVDNILVSKKDINEKFHSFEGLFPLMVQYRFRDHHRDRILEKSKQFYNFIYIKCGIRAKI